MSYLYLYTSDGRGGDGEYLEEGRKRREREGGGRRALVWELDCRSQGSQGRPGKTL